MKGNPRLKLSNSSSSPFAYILTVSFMTVNPPFRICTVWSTWISSESDVIAVAWTLAGPQAIKAVVRAAITNKMRRWRRWFLTKLNTTLSAIIRNLLAYLLWFTLITISFSGVTLHCARDISQKPSPRKVPSSPTSTRVANFFKYAFHR